MADEVQSIASPSAAVDAIHEVLAAPWPWDLPAASRQLVRVLKALQHHLQQVCVCFECVNTPQLESLPSLTAPAALQTRTSAAQDARLVPCLQSLLCFGYSAEDEAPAPAPPSSPSKRYLPPAARRGPRVAVPRGILRLGRG